MLKTQIDAFADDAGVASDGRTDQIWSQLQHRIGVELGFEPFFGKFDTIAVARKLAVLLHCLWVSGEVYEPLRQGTSATTAPAVAA